MKGLEQNAVLGELGELTDFLTKAMLENYPRIRDTYQDRYGWPELDPLRNEIALCLLLGLNQAGITLTNHLTESFLKLALTYHHTKLTHKAVHQMKTPTVGELKAFTEDGLKLYGKNELATNINLARSLGLLTKSEKKQMHEFRNHFRNAYGHADKVKTFGDGSAPITPINLDSVSNAIGDEEDVSIADLPMIQGLLQVMQAKRDAIPYFLFVDNLVRDVMNNRIGQTGSRKHS